MYIYITTKLNDGYKIGIAEDIEQRQQQYTTLIPNIGFEAAIQTQYAEEIEKSFKIKFQDYRIINRTSSKSMKSEVYKTKIDYLKMHLVHCMHRFCKTVIIEDSHLAFSKNVYLKNKVNIYLSNYYLLNKLKFINFTELNDDFFSVKLKIGEITGSSALFDTGKFKGQKAKLKFKKFNQKNFKQFIDLFSKYFGKKKQYDLNDMVKELNIEEIEKTFEGYYLYKNTYISPCESSMSYISGLWFDNLINFNILRPYNIEKLRNEPYGNGSLAYLKLFNNPYPKKNKIEL
ncbi:GIY-YIG nuclease family protein [Candidatus Pelagibacter sp.]|uniref:GIY-YIG nuclease family protein n=1 Tax=Candidatus Pelagibacter sp. TaxID=2024849 RepID=UPI003F8554E0